VLSSLADAYAPGQTLATAFANVMVRLFSRHGLILLDPSDLEIHQIASPLLQKAALETESVVSALLERTKEIEAIGYDSQVKVTPASTLLFFLKDGARVAIHKKNGGFGFNGEHWSADDLRSRIETNPELFSANVLLRPVLQDYLLPTATYVAGPAETAYFAQVQVVYQHLGGRTTPVWPRFSTTLVEARLASWMRKYGLRLRDVLHPKDEFVSMLSRRTFPADIKDDFDRSRQQLDRLLTPLLQSLQKLDPTIASAGEVAGQKMRYQLDQLESRAARAHLQREQVLGRHAGLLSTMLFPERELQERKIAGIYFIARHGEALIDQLIESYKPECRDHQVIELS
jgi:bacillithiol biosynthesis cysteine-adding enzyme BshC